MCWLLIMLSPVTLEVWYFLLNAVLGDFLLALHFIGLFGITIQASHV